MTIISQHFVFDVESIGLLGEGFAFGATLGRVLDSGEWVEDRSWFHACDRNLADGGHRRGDLVALDRAWVATNVPTLEHDCLHPAEVRRKFYEAIRSLVPPLSASLGTRFWCDWGHPVDVPFVRDVMRQEGWVDVPGIDDINSLARLVGMPSLARLPEHQPEHHPLNDARHSARRLAWVLTAFWRLKGVVR